MNEKEKLSEDILIKENVNLKKKLICLICKKKDSSKLKRNEIG